MDSIPSLLWVRLGNALIERMFSASATSGHANGCAYGVGLRVDESMP